MFLTLLEPEEGLTIAGSPLPFWSTIQTASFN